MLSRWMIPVALALALALGLVPAVLHAQESGRPATLSIAFPQEDGSLTPYTFRSGYALMSLVYDTLTLRDADGIPQPWLARTVRRDQTGTRVTVTLREGVRWHDGRPLTAGDVAFTFRHFASRAHPRFTPQVREIRSVSAVDRRTVVFDLRRPSLGFEDQPLADVPILPRHLWEGLPERQLAPGGLPVGSGPFRLVAHDIGRSYRFEANASHFRGPPAVERIDVPIIGQQEESIDALRDRQVDAAPVIVPAGSSLFSRAGIRVADNLSYTGTMLLFNVAGGPFTQEPARRAVARAIDVEEVAQSSGAAVPATSGVLHPASAWAPDDPVAGTDPTAARVAFAEEGVRPFTVLVLEGDAIRVDAGRRVVRALRRVGAQARLVTSAPAGFERALEGEAGAPAFDAAVVGFPALASYDPAFLDAVFGDPATAPLNYGGYRSARFESLTDRVASARTTAERERAVVDQVELLADDLPALPLFFGGGTFAYRGGTYDGWVDVRGTGILDKRSFVDGPAPATGTSSAPVDPLDTNDGSGGTSLLPVIAVFAAMLVGAALWRIRRRR
jgi:peptide/nickel transport system substrate-binding protein